MKVRGDYYKMQISTRSLRNAAVVSIVALSSAVLAACVSSQPKAMLHNKDKQRPKEYFSESQYGVKASPRVTNLATRLPRGGGRDQLGKPYMVAGKMYYPKEDRKYRRKGSASWYGDAFHGRLTANGEIYDMTSLTAAHPTMPLPSYARVTNLANGSSVIVRVNDRGPYADGRIIDLSKRAAEMLDYQQAGVAKVQVEYVGRAPLDGEDDAYLMASYKPGKDAPDFSDGLPAGVMIAMNGPTPSMPVGAGTAAVSAFDAFPLPPVGPIAPERPGLIPQTQVALASMSYAMDGATAADRAFAILDGTLDKPAASGSWKQGRVGRSRDYVAVGSYRDAAEATRVARELSAYGRPALVRSEADGVVWHSVTLETDGRQTLDEMLQAAWSRGASDAMPVRN